MLRIMTANLYNGAARPTALDAALAQTEPDLLLAQELAPNAAAVVADHLPEGLIDPRIDHHGAAIAARLPIHVEVLPITRRRGLRTVLEAADWPGLERDLEVCNVHLANPVSLPMRDSVEARRRQVDDILDHVRSRPMARVIAGDFNSTPIWPAYRRLVGTLEDGPRQSGTAVRTWGPWWWFPRLLRIDHAFVQQCRVVASHRVAIAGSDHSALVVDVTTDAPDGL